LQSHQSAPETQCTAMSIMRADLPDFGGAMHEFASFVGGSLFPRPAVFFGRRRGSVALQAPAVVL
jgi:hypothetical protein